MITEKTSYGSLRLPGPVMSKLLGISLIEYYNLHHSALEESKDESGNTLSYYMTIYESNDPLLLSKLPTDQYQRLYFSLQQIADMQSR